MLLLLHKFCLGNFRVLIFSVVFTLCIRIPICVLRLKFSKLCNQYNWAEKHSITWFPFEQPTDSVCEQPLDISHDNANSQMTIDGFLIMYNHRKSKCLVFGYRKDAWIWNITSSCLFQHERIHSWNGHTNHYAENKKFLHFTIKMRK